MRELSSVTPKEEMKGMVVLSTDIEVDETCERRDLEPEIIASGFFFVQFQVITLYPDENVRKKNLIIS